MNAGETLQIRRKITKGNLLFGEYTLLHVIAQGRVGVICQAEHNSLKRPSVLKMVHPAYAEREGYSFALIEAFLREARIMAAVEHPHVMPVYHAGTVGQCPFIAMRLVRGGTVQARVKASGAVTPDWALKLLLQAAQGLQAIHGAGFVHGDLRPENILLETDGSPRITDFDQAAPLAAGKLAGAIEPSPYAAPELIAGGRIDQRTDLRALGATIIHAGTAADPIVGDAAAIAEAMARANPAAARAPAPLAPLAAILAKLTVADPDARYGGCEELIEDCRAVAAGGEPAHALGKGGVRKEMFSGFRQEPPVDDGKDPFGE